MNLSLCKDAKSWKTLYEAAQIRNHQTTLSAPVGDNGFPTELIKYHRGCRSKFMLKKSLESLRFTEDHETKDTKNEKRRSVRDTTSSSSVILPSRCIFCKKDKYKPKTRTREKLQSCCEFRADDTVRKSALAHVTMCSWMADVAEQILAMCSKDLISSEAKYHASCYKNFVRPCHDVSEIEISEYVCNEPDPLYEAVESYCRELIRSPRVVEFRSIRKVMSDKAGSLHIEVPPSTYKNLIRKVSTDFKGQLNFIQQSANNTLVYLCTLTIEDLVIDNYKLKSEQESMKEFVDDEEKVTIKVAKTLNKLVNDHPLLMSWPPKENDILPNKVSQYIPKLLDVFCNTLLSSQSSASENSRIMRLKNSIAQDIVYCVSGGKTKTPQSVLFSTVVKSLCNNVEVVKLINNYGHGISYNLIEEIETEHALMVINEQKENKVILPNEAFQDNEYCCVGLMVADNIDNLECTLTGSGTSHRVNSIFVKRKAAQEGVSTTEEEEYVQPTK